MVDFIERPISKMELNLFIAAYMGEQALSDFVSIATSMVQDAQGGSGSTIGIADHAMKKTLKLDLFRGVK